MVVFVVAPLFGAVIERVIMRGLQGTSEVVKIVVTVSLLLALIGLGNLVWPPDVGRNNQTSSPTEFVRILGVNVSYHRLLIFGVAALVAIVLRFILYRTRVGITMRAVVDDRPLVQLNGGRPDRAAMMSWALGAVAGGRVGRADLLGVRASADPAVAAGGQRVLPLRSWVGCAACR